MSQQLTLLCLPCSFPIPVQLNWDKAVAFQVGKTQSQAEQELEHPSFWAWGPPKLSLAMQVLHSHMMLEAGLGSHCIYLMDKLCRAAAPLERFVSWHSKPCKRFHLFKASQFKFPLYLFKNLQSNFSVSSGENWSKLYRAMLATSDISHSCFPFSINWRIKKWCWINTPISYQGCSRGVVNRDGCSVLQTRFLKTL